MGALTLLRHTRPDLVDGVCYGRTNLDVDGSFEGQAEIVLNDAPEADLIVSSPLRRCQVLADYIAKFRKQSVTVDDRLQEMDFGNWENRLWSDIPRAELDAWALDFLDARPHGGESVAMLQARVSEALQEYQTMIETCLIVTHAGVIKAAFAGVGQSDGYDKQIDFGGIVRLPEVQTKDAS